MTKPRVLIIAEAANPEFVSVPLVGWSIAQALREVADVHLVTQIRNREAILRAGLVEGQDFTAIDSEKLASPLWKLATALRMGEGKGWTMVQAISSISYKYFERLVWKKFGPAIKRGEYDIVHRVTPLTPTVSSSIASKCKSVGVPFMLGPLNGGVPWPKGFDAERRREREWLSYIRNAYKILPGRTKALRASSAILVGSRHTQSEIPDTLQERCVYMPENGIDPLRFDRLSEPDEEGPLRIGFVGRLVPYKGVDMLIEAALPLLISQKARLEIIGDGPMKEALQRQVAKSNVADTVAFHGWKKHHEVQDILCRCHMLGFPSIREFGGGVVLEAMALGVPPLVVDYAGPGELVSEGVGFKVPIATRPEIVASFRSEIEKLQADRSLLKDVGVAAKQYVETKFLWSRKAEQIFQVYEWVLKTVPDRPKFF